MGQVAVTDAEVSTIEHADHRPDSSEGQSPEHVQLEGDGLKEVCLELQQKSEELEDVSKLSDAVNEIEHLKREKRQGKERYKQLWQMNCANLEEHDTALAAKDEEIGALQEQLHRRPEIMSAATGGGAGSATRVVVEFSPMRQVLLLSRLSLEGPE